MNSLMSSQSILLKGINLFRMAAYAKKHLEIGREYKEKLPKNAHRAFLMAIETE